MERPMSDGQQMKLSDEQLQDFLAITSHNNWIALMARELLHLRGRLSARKEDLRLLGLRCEAAEKVIEASRPLRDLDNCLLEHACLYDDALEAYDTLVASLDDRVADSEKRG